MLLSSKSSSGSYVLQITPLTSHYAASASSPSNVIDLFDKSTLQPTQTLPGHEKGTTSLRTAHNLSSGECLVSSGKDGIVTVWDVRSNKHSIKMMNSSDSALLCCDISSDGSTIAAGSDLNGDDAFIFYWDPRQPTTPIRTHSSTHSDDITTLSFLPYKPHPGRNILLSGSTDGLLCTSYADEDDEDEAIVQIGNLGSSISQAGWIYGGDLDPPSSAAIWAATDMETFSTWTRDLDQLMSPVDIRAPSLREEWSTWSADYLITAHSSPTCAPKLCLFTGNNEGDVAQMSNTNISAREAPWCFHELWKQGHSGIVRALFWDEVNQVLITGGEDSKLNAWSIHPIASGDDEEESDEDEMMLDYNADVKMG